MDEPADLDRLCDALLRCRKVGALRALGVDVRDLHALREEQNLALKEAGERVLQCAADLDAALAEVRVRLKEQGDANMRVAVELPPSLQRMPRKLDKSAGG